MRVTMDKQGEEGFLSLTCNYIGAPNGLHSVQRKNKSDKIKYWNTSMTS